MIGDANRTLLTMAILVLVCPGLPHKTDDWRKRLDVTRLYSQITIHKKCLIIGNCGSLRWLCVSREFVFIQFPEKYYEHSSPSIRGLGAVLEIGD